jgi:hypothetical protein
MRKACNLCDVACVDTARTNLGLGSIALLNCVDISANTNLTASNGVCLTGDALSAVASEINHNSLLNYVANEHRCICDGTLTTSSMMSSCYIDCNYYTQTELSTCGSSNVHWGNVTNHCHASEHLSTGTDIVAHDSLSGFSGCTHACITGHIQCTGNPHSVTQTQVGLSAVTNDAQLKRSCADWTGFGEKVSPSDGDYLLIEDSLNAFRKCYVLMCNMPTCVASTRVKICAGDTTADYLCQKIQVGGSLTCSIVAGGGNNYICLCVPATSANTASTIVCRAADCSFCAGTITANLTGCATCANAAVSAGSATSAGTATLAVNLCVATYCYDGNGGRPTMRASYADTAGSAGGSFICSSNGSWTGKMCGGCLTAEADDSGCAAVYGEASGLSQCGAVWGNYNDVVCNVGIGVLGINSGAVSPSNWCSDFTVAGAGVAGYSTLGVGGAFCGCCAGVIGFSTGSWGGLFAKCVCVETALFSCCIVGGARSSGNLYLCSTISGTKGNIYAQDIFCAARYIESVNTCSPGCAIIGKATGACAGGGQPIGVYGCSGGGTTCCLGSGVYGFGWHGVAGVSDAANGAGIFGDGCNCTWAGYFTNGNVWVGCSIQACYKSNDGTIGCTCAVTLCGVTFNFKNGIFVGT